MPPMPGHDGRGAGFRRTLRMFTARRGDGRRHHGTRGICRCSCEPVCGGRWPRVHRRTVRRRGRNPLIATPPVRSAPGQGIGRASEFVHGRFLPDLGPWMSGDSGYTRRAVGSASADRQRGAVWRGAGAAPVRSSR